MEWKELCSVLNQKFDIGRCMDKLRSIYETDHWNDFDKYLETAEYCADSMKKAGLTQIEKLPLKADGKTMYGDWKLPRAWRVRKGILRYTTGEVISDYHKKTCALCMYSPATAGEVEAEVIDISGMKVLPDDGSLRGKLLLTDLQPGAALPLARQVGAIGVLSDSMRLFPGIRDSKEEMYDECLWEGIGQAFPDNTIFGFKLTPRQGDRLREELRQGSVRLVAEVDAELYDGVCHTVSGLLEGTDPSLPEVFAYGHLYEPGANDNASGSGALLELAKCFSEAIEEGLLPRPKRSIRFAMGNECGGSMGYLMSHPERKHLCSGVFDMVGTETIDRATLSVRYDPIPNWSFADAAIVASDRIYKECFGADYRFIYEHFREDLGTDNINIADPAFDTPTVAMVAAPATSYHSSLDTPDRIEPDVLKRNALILGVYLYGLADANEETCEFLAEEIRAMAQQELAAADHPRMRQQVTEAMERALHSLRKICSELPYELPCEEVPPLPEYAAEKGEWIPVRLVPGCLSLAGRPELKNPRWRPSWNVELNVPLFWVDGKRTLWQVAAQTACEMGQSSDIQLREKYEQLSDYFQFLVELGYMEWKTIS